jgi:hypothetical protein
MKDNQHICTVCEEEPGIFKCRYYGKLGFYGVGCISARLEDFDDPIEQFILIKCVA